jgi:hypothetical protein
MQLTLRFRLRKIAIFAVTVILVGLASSASGGNCSIHFGSTICAAGVDPQSLSIINSLSDCTNIGTENPNPIKATPGAANAIVAGCTATGSTTTIPVTVCFNSDPQSFGASLDSHGVPLQFTVMASCPGFKAKPVHLVIKSWHLDFATMKLSNQASPCRLDIESTLLVANVGKGNYTGGFNDALVAWKCASTQPYSCGNQSPGGLMPIFQLGPESTTTKKISFHVDCSPPSPSVTITGGSVVATWDPPCRANITCDPGFPVATEDLLLVCGAGEKLLSACGLY